MKDLEKILDKSSCLIIDLRGNGGGCSAPGEGLSSFLYGVRTPAALKTYIRTTPEAVKIQSRNPNRDWGMTDKSKDPTVWQDNSDSYNSPWKYPKFGFEKPGYKKPIYILIDGGTGSSAEIFILSMNKHPYVKFIGDNSAGKEVYGYIGFSNLKNSRIEIAAGNVYRELEIKNFELNGFSPDIACADGQDALELAILDYNISKNTSKIKSPEKTL